MAGKNEHNSPSPGSVGLRGAKVPVTGKYGILHRYLT